MSDIKVDTVKLERANEIREAGNKIVKYAFDLDVFYRKLMKYEGYAKNEFSNYNDSQSKQLILLGKVYTAISEGLLQIKESFEEVDEKLARENKNVR